MLLQTKKLAVVPRSLVFALDTSLKEKPDFVSTEIFPWKKINQPTIKV